MNIYYIDQIVGDAVDAIIIMGKKRKKSDVYYASPIVQSIAFDCHLPCLQKLSHFNGTLHSLLLNYFGYQIFWSLAYMQLMKVILETHREYYIWYLRFYCLLLSVVLSLPDSIPFTTKSVVFNHYHRYCYALPISCRNIFRFCRKDYKRCIFK